MTKNKNKQLIFLLTTELFLSFELFSIKNAAEFYTFSAYSSIRSSIISSVSIKS